MFTNFFKNVRYMQYLCALIATLPIANGVMLSLWLAPSLPKLTSPNSPIGTTVTVEQVSWLVASSSLGGVCIATCRMLFADLWFGRRTWLLISGGCLTAAWITLYFGKHLLVLCLARFIGGVGSSSGFITAPMYIAEVVEDDVRGKLSMAGGIFSLFVVVFLFTVGPFISYWNLVILCSILPIAFLVAFYFMPESPYYQIKNGRTEEALHTLTRLSSQNSEDGFIKKRFTQIEESVAYDSQNKSNIWECISKTAYRRSLIIMIGAKSLLQLSGINVIEVYSQSIIAKTNSSISPELSSVLFGVIQIPAAVIASFLVDRVGRKPLWMLSALGCALALFGEGFYFYLEETDSITWLPTTCILLYLIMSPIGVSTLPLVIAGEIFSTNIKGAAISLCTLYGSVLSFIVLKYSEPAAEEFGRYAVLWTFAAFCIAGMFFVMFVVPETKGKSLEEIQQMLNKKRKPDDSIESN